MTGQEGQEGQEGTRRLAIEAALVALVVVVVHVALRLSDAFLIGALGDDGVYVVLGKAIGQGSGYHSIHLVGAPVHVRYPPGLPLLLAIPWTGGGSLAAVRGFVAVVQPAVTAAAAALVWWFGRRRLDLPRWPLAVCAVAPFLLDPTIQYYNLPLAEPYFVLGWIGALVLAAPLAADAGGPRPLGRALLVGVVLAVTTLFRAAGIALVPAVLVALALRRRWRSLAACAVGALVPLAAWAAVRAAWVAQGPVSALPDDLGYWHWLDLHGPVALVGYAGRSVAVNVIQYVGRLAGYLAPSLVVGSVLVVVAAVAAAVACVRWRSTQTLLILTVVCVAGLTLLWPFTQGRLLLPLLPFLGLLAAGAIRLSLGGAGVRRERLVYAALALVALTGALRQAGLRRAAAEAYRTGVVRPQDQSPILTLALRSLYVGQVVGWVQANATPQDRIMVQAPAAVYLYTGRRTVSALPTESRLGASVFERPGRYVAGRLLADSVTVIALAPPAPELDRDLATIAERCPGVLTLAGDPTPSSVYFRVARDETCLRSLQ